MKKNKSSKPPAEFNNNPFKSLRSFKPQSGSPSKQAPEQKKEKKEKQDDEARLFLQAVSGTRSLHAKEPEQRDEATKGRPTEPVPVDDEEQKKLFLQAMQKIGARLREPAAKPEQEDAAPRSSSSRMKQLKRGTIRIREELDLHGHCREEALAKLERFVSGSYGRGEKAVLVITGKGINSPEGPVLQGAVADWLRGKGRAIVAEFAPAPRDLGGSGAYVVFLKNRER